MSDLIDRQAVLDKFKALCDACGEGEKYNGVMCRCCSLDDGITIVEDIPSAEPERKWIPVSEALPKDMDRLLATIVMSDGSKRVRSGNYYKGYFMMDNGDTWNEPDKEILAWMPLPEPWRGDR